MPMLRAIRTLNNLEAGTLTGSGLQTLLADTGRLGDFVSLIAQRGFSRRMAASSTAMTAVAASSTAMTAVVASPMTIDTLLTSSTARPLLIASSAAMTAVAASATVMADVVDNATWLAEIGASNTALAALFASSAVRVALYDHASALTTLTNITNVRTYLLAAYPNFTTTNSTSHVSVNAGRTLLLSQKASGGATSYAGAGADTYTTTSTGGVDRFVKVSGLTQRTSSSSYYSAVQYVDMD